MTGFYFWSPSTSEYEVHTKEEFLWNGGFQSWKPHAIFEKFFYATVFIQKEYLWKKNYAKISLKSLLATI